MPELGVFLNCPVCGRPVRLALDDLRDILEGGLWFTCDDGVDAWGAPTYCNSNFVRNRFTTD